MFTCRSCKSQYITLPLSKLERQRSPFLNRVAETVRAHFCPNTCDGNIGIKYECDNSCALNVSRRSRCFHVKKQLIKHLSKYHTYLKQVNVSPAGCLVGNIETLIPCGSIVCEVAIEDHNSLSHIPLDENNPFLLEDDPSFNDDTFLPEAGLQDNSDSDDDSIQAVPDLGDMVPNNGQQYQVPPSPTDEMQSGSLNLYLLIVSRFSYFAGVCCLVCRSAFQNKAIRSTEAFANLVPKDFVLLYLNIALLVSTHGAKENELFASVVDFFLSIIVELDAYLPKGSPLKEKLEYIYRTPATVKEFLSKLEQPSNKDSLRSLLPIPLTTHNKKTEHGFCMPTELIPMAMFLPPMDNKEEHNHHRYRSIVVCEDFLQKRMLVPEIYRTDVQVMNTPTVLVYVILWSDGWDPNRSNKGNRSPVWSATATLLFVELGIIDKPYLVVTELLAAGPGKHSHDQLFILLKAEKEGKWEDAHGQLKSFTFFSKHHGCNANVFITLGFVLQDNPERRGAVGLLAGNSNNHGIFGVSCYFEQLEIPFEACAICHVQMVRYLQEQNFDTDCINWDCPHCLGWSLKKLCRKGRYTNQITDKLRLVPTDHGYNLTLGPGKIDFLKCKAAWELATTKYIDEFVWGSGNTEAYLRLFCMNDSLIARFMDEATTYINIKEALDVTSQSFLDDEERQHWLDLYNNDNGNFHKPKYPAIWDLYQINDFTETPMHLGQGCQKAVLKSVLLYCTLRNKGAEFVNRCRTLLLQLKAVRVDIAPVMPFKDDKFGGFVAENYSAVTMVLVWLSRVLTEAKQQPGPSTVVPDPTLKDVEHWTGIECKAWLKERGQNSTYTASSAREKVSDFLKGPENDMPVVIPNVARTTDPQLIRLLLQSANSVFGSIMSKDLIGVQAENRSQAIISLFLSNYESVDKKLMPNRKKAVWLAKYNFLGLLRVPEHFSRYQLFRNLYEGGDIGEGMVKQLRKLCPSGVRGGWTKNMLNRFYRQRAMQGLLVDAKSGALAGYLGETKSQSFRKKFRIYPNLTTVKLYLGHARPMSVIVCQNSSDRTFHFGLVVNKNTEEWMIHEIKLNYELGLADPLGYTYFPVQLEDIGHTVSQLSDPILPGCHFYAYGLMLPDNWTPRQQEDVDFYKYAFLGEDWQHFKTSVSWSCIL
jgi:hypothetical protein